MALVEFVMVTGRSEVIEWDDKTRQEAEAEVESFLDKSNSFLSYEDGAGTTVYILRNRVHSARVSG